jgi:hypothetical protein
MRHYTSAEADITSKARFVFVTESLQAILFLTIHEEGYDH